MTTLPNFSIAALQSAPVLRAIPYVAPLTPPQGVRLYLNENLRGPAPACIEELAAKDASEVYLYAEGDRRLQQALASYHGVDAERVCINAGAAGILQQIAQTFLDRGDTVLLPRPGWDYYRGLAQLMGARVDYFDLKSTSATYEFDADLLNGRLSAVHPKMCVITSPNMPTGNSFDPDSLDDLVSRFPGTLFVIDQAYHGFSGDRTYEAPSVARRRNVILVRTFSKFFALASARVGYSISDGQVAAALRKFAPLFGIPIASQRAAVAALESVDYYESLRRDTVQTREEFRQELCRSGAYRAFSSDANFVLVQSLRLSPSDVVGRCQDMGFIVRDASGYGLTSHLRVSIGTKPQMRRLSQVLTECAETVTQR